MRRDDRDDTRDDNQDTSADADDQNGDQDAQDRSNRAWDLNTRGHWIYEDTETGERHEIDNADIEKRVEALNHAAGYARYEVVPYHHLNR